MKRLVAIASLAAVTLAVSLAPAAAKQKKYRHYGHPYTQSQAYQQGWNGGWTTGGWTSRNVAADPSFGNRAGINYARRTGRCVEDLGYGRFEYCGW